MASKANQGSSMTFPPAGKRGPTRAWANRVMRLWEKAGYPNLIGAGAEQVHLARAILGLRPGQLL